jgi:repressor LexA
LKKGEMTELTTRQREILEYIRSTVADRGYPPAVREIGDAVGLSSPSTVHSHLSTLVRLGYLRRDPSKPRAIEVVDGQSHVQASPAQAGVRNVPLVGSIAAGSPILAEEDIQDVFPLPQQFVGNGPVFMLEIKGDSMVDAGIFSGDYVIVEQTKDARDGQIVAALVDQDTATVKRLERRDDVVVLHAENPAYEPMVFNDGVELLGTVVAVLRSLR